MRRRTHSDINAIVALLLVVALGLCAFAYFKDKQEDKQIGPSIERQG